MRKPPDGMERLVKLACALYPREFRRLLGRDLASLAQAELRRVRAERGRAAAVRYGVSTLARVFLGAIPARFANLGQPRAHADAVLHDTRFALRGMVRSPGFTAAALASLALGIGANAAIFSVVDVILLRGLPYPDAGRLVALWEYNEAVGVRGGVSGATFLDWRDQAGSFEDMVLFQPGTATITSLSEPEQVPGMRVTVNFLEFLGYRPAQGRDFRADESRGGRADVAIVSRGFLNRLQAGGDTPIGTELMGDHLPYTLVGVLPADYWFPLRADLFVPWDEDELRAQDRTTREFGVLARLRPGVTLDQARAEMAAIAARLARDQADLVGWRAEIAYAEEEATASMRPALFVLLGAVGFVLLIACANVANLLLARATRRQAEIATRAAIGASRFRLVRQLVTESVLLAIVGGALGLGVGHLGVAGLAAVLPTEIAAPNGDVPLLLPAIDVDWRVILFTSCLALATGLLFGLVPAWQTAFADLNGPLRGAAAAGGAAGGRLRRGLVAAEIALAVVLLVGTGLMLQTFWNLSTVDPGFVPADVLTMQLELPTDSRYRTDAEQADLYRQVLDRLQRIPGVEAAGISEVLPLDSAVRRLEFNFVADRQPLDAPGIGVDYNITDDGFFDALRIPLVGGRLFDRGDDRDQPWVVVVDTTFVQQHMGGRDPMGELVEVWEAEFAIIGVVGAVRSAGLEQRPRPTIYFHYLQAPDNLMTYLMRTRGTLQGLVAAAKEAVWAIDPEQPVFNVRRMDSVVAGGSASRRLTLQLLAVFGAVAVAMAALGVYGVMSYAIGQRTRELGLRHALGADRARLVGMILREGMRIAANGVVAGIAAGIILTRGMSSLLYGVTSAEPIALGAVAFVVFAVAVLACWLPARRAARIDPMEALRLG